MTNIHIIDLFRLALTGVVLYLAVAHGWQFARARHERIHLWVAVWGVLAAVMLVARVIQQAAFTPDTSVWPTRALIGAGVGIAPVAVSAAHAFMLRPPDPVLRALQICGVIVVATSLFTDWLFYWEAAERTDALGRSYFAASFGSLAPLVGVYTVAATIYCIRALRRARGFVDETGRLLTLLPLFLLLVLSANDTLMLAELITSVHTADVGAALLGIAFSYVLGHRSREYYNALERDGALRARLIEGVIEAQEVERERIARDLHESTGQTLTSLAMHLRAVEQAPDLDALRAQIADIRALTKGALEQVRSVARGLHPAALDDFGLVVGLSQHIDELRAAHDIDIDVLLSGFDAHGRLPASIELALYRIAQEALSNAVRRAAATTVSVVIDRSPAQVRMIIEDDGCGFDVDRAQGLGLLSMRERAAASGGTLTIESTTGAGTGVFVVIPLRQAATASARPDG